MVVSAVVCGLIVGGAVVSGSVVCILAGAVSLVGSGGAVRRGVAVLGVLVALMLGRTEIGKKGTSNYKDLTIK